MVNANQASGNRPLNATRLDELCTIKPDSGFYTNVVLNSTYQALTKFHKHKKFVLLSALDKKNYCN